MQLLLVFARNFYPLPYTYGPHSHHLSDMKFPSANKVVTSRNDKMTSLNEKESAYKDQIIKKYHDRMPTSK